MNDVSPARIQRREQILVAANALVGASVEPDFDPVHSPLCVIDVCIAAGAPWLKDGMERDYYKDESGYKKIGGGSNRPDVTYFFRSTVNLVHFLKRQGFYVPRGDVEPCSPGMLCIFDWDDRGRFNFTPDRCGIISALEDDQISEVILPVKQASGGPVSFEVEKCRIKGGSLYDKAIIGYSDFP